MRPRLPLVELTSCRMKEFLREPEAVFWVFAFPILLAVALGFAFREKPPDKIPVGVVAAGEAGARMVAALGKAPGLAPKAFPEREGREALRTGRISLLVEPGPPAVLRLHETRPESRLARPPAR